MVIPSYNKAPYLPATLESIASQTYPHLELIVVDDASTDSSVEIIHEWARQASIPTQVIVHGSNQGLCRTLNDGFALARGEFVAQLGADDQYLPHKIARHVEVLQSKPEAVFVYGDARWEDHLGNVLAESFADHWFGGVHPYGEVFALYVYQGTFVPALTVTMRGSALDAVGPFDESLRFEDVDMWIRLARIGEVAYSGSIDAVHLRVPDSLRTKLGNDRHIGQLRILAKVRDDPRLDLEKVRRRAVRRTLLMSPDGGVRGDVQALVQGMRNFPDPEVTRRAAKAMWQRRGRRGVAQ